MKQNKGKRRLAHRIACFLLTVFMIFGLFQPELRVYAEGEPLDGPIDNTIIIIEEELDEDEDEDDPCKNGHTWNQGTVTREATYTSYGVMTYTCTNCGNTRTETIPQLVCGSHTWDAGTVTTQPTYDSEGVMTHTCTTCGKTRTGAVPKLYPENSATVSLAVYGSTQRGCYIDPYGNYVYCMDECKKPAVKGGEIYTKSIGGGYEIYNGIFGVQQEAFSEGKLSDFNIRVITQWAIWSKAGGSRRDTVSFCYGDNGLDLYDRMMNADPDDYNVTYIKYTPTDDCYQPCAGAYTVSKNEPQHTHSWDAGIVTRESTCNAEGEKTYTCTGCGETKTEVIPKLVCTDHVWDAGKVTKEATYTATGVRTFTCTNCGQTKTETIPKLTCSEHVYGEKILTQANDGNYYYTSVCTRCGEKHSELHEHDYKWVTIKPASEEEAGTERHLCEECGHYSLEREIPKIETHVCTHPYPRNFVETVPATCCRGPIGNVVCKECGEIIVYDYESPSRGYDPDNHTHFTESIRVEPTYKTTGVKRYTCDGCGYYYTESIPKLDCPHAHTNIKDLADGSWKVCKDCGEKLYRVSSIPSRCNHIGTVKTQVLIKAPTATEWGEAAIVCECGRTVSTEQLHPYSEYQVTKPDGSVVTVYGWFDHDAAHEIAEQTNAYRVQNGLNALVYNESLQSASDTRALETIVCFDHTRPNGTRWNTTCPEWTYGGENLASGQTTVESAMNAWKESESHNANLLYGIKSGQTPFKGISVGVFHRVIFPYDNKPYTQYEYTYWTQQFTFY